MTIPVVPVGLPVFDKEGMKTYFKELDEKYGIDLGRRFEDGSIHSLPQDYADMIGWEELTVLADSAWRMIGDKESAFIYAIGEPISPKSGSLQGSIAYLIYVTIRRR